MGNIVLDLLYIALAKCIVLWQADRFRKDLISHSTKYVLIKYFPLFFLALVAAVNFIIDFINLIK